jgi:hypothetical protein
MQTDDEVSSRGKPMRSILIAVVSSFSLCAGAALAADTTPAPTTVADAQHIPAGDGSQVVCLHRIHDGTLTSAVDCRTKSTWDKIRRENQESITLWQMRALSMPAR